jgi:hypothetical protein
MTGKFNVVEESVERGACLPGLRKGAASTITEEE